jgi:hypothetical protein
MFCFQRSYFQRNSAWVLGVIEIIMLFLRVYVRFVRVYKVSDYRNCEIYLQRGK